MFADALHYTSKCQECAIVTGSGRTSQPSLHPTSVQQTFQIMGIHIMELPPTMAGNHYVLVF